MNLKGYYNFINGYNSLINLLNNDNNNYLINVYYEFGKLNINITERDTFKVKANKQITCTLEEAEEIINIIGFQFAMNHQINLSTFSKLDNLDSVVSPIHLINNNFTLTENGYTKDNYIYTIHELANNKFNLRLYHEDNINMLNLDMYAKSKMYTENNHNNKFMIEFYEFINAYNCAINECLENELESTIKFYYNGKELVLEIKDYNNRIILNETIPCSKVDSEVIMYIIGTEFKLNHNLTLSCYRNVEFNEDLVSIEELYNLGYGLNDDEYTNNGYSQNIHEIVNNFFKLRFYHLNGIPYLDTLLHNDCLNKICNTNKKLVK